MKKVYVISEKNFPARLPIWSTLTTYLMLDKFNAPGWLWGALGLLFLVLWIAQIIGKFIQEYVDVFGFEKESTEKERPKNKSKFQERLQEMAKQRGYTIPEGAPKTDGGEK